MFYRLVTYPSPEVLGLLVLTCIFWVVWVVQRTFNRLNGNASNDSSRQSKDVKVRTSAEKTTSKPNQSQVIAARLRQLASEVEDAKNELVWKVENIQIEKTTNSTRVQAMSHLYIGRSGFKIPYRSNNSRTGKVQEINKQWRNIAGCTDDDYVLYLSTTSAVRFYPSSKDALFFNIVWQVFSEPMNHGGYAFLEPKKHQLGEKLRVAARKLEEDYSNSELPKSLVIPPVPKVIKSRISVAKPNELPEFAEPPTEGDSIAGYRLDRRLGGNSGQGNVYQATNLKSRSSTAAIKIFKVPDGKRLSRSQFAAMGETFVEEAQLAANYPHVPFLLVPQDYGLYPWPWIRYPVLRGNTANGPLESAEWWNLAHDLLAGLAEIHADGRVHLDIKPDNIIIESDCAKILDFGLASIEGVSTTINSQASSGLTFPFASPEQLRGDTLKKLTAASDLFSAGITLYHARTGGRSPFKPITRVTDPEDFNSLQLAYLDSRRTLALDARLIEEDGLYLIEKMLQFEPGARITAAEGLNLIASKVDVEAKTHLIEEALLSVYEHKATERIQENEASNQYQIDGPFKSWSVFENELQRILNSARPRYVVVNFMSAKGKLLNYVQAYFDYDGWRLEVSKPSGSSKDERAAQSQKLMDLGWEAPSKEVPNFGRSIKSASSVELTNFCVDAFERALSLNVSQVSAMVINTQGEGHY
jgi:serine/threonine protein kinase